MSRPANRLHFKDPKTPYSPQFDDIYFSNEVGIEESIYVYLEGSGALASIQSGTRLVRIGEVGFGVGLNFILTLRAFLEHAKPDQRLHYVSVEKFPIECEDLATLYNAYPEIEPVARTLLEQYPVLTPGNHRLFFGDGRVILDLMIGDAIQEFARNEFTVDHWYWDGFSPSKNPDAFSDEIFAVVQKRSALGARGSSFTAATWVRRCLEARGFQVSKRKGYGRKRECIEGILITEGARDESPAWFAKDKFKTLALGDRIGVLGAGLSGSAIARALAIRGFQVEVWDGNGLANRASSNSVGLFNVQLSKKINPISRFSQAALTHFLRELKTLKLPHRLGISRVDADAIECLADSAYPDSFYQKRETDVLLPACGMIHPQVLCEKRLAHPQIQFFAESIAKVTPQGQRFILSDTQAKVLSEVDHVVYALGADTCLKVSALAHEEIDCLPLRAIRGQTALVEPNLESAKISEVRVNEGYLSPLAPEVTGHAYHLLGATFQANESLPNQIEIDREKLIHEAREKWPEFHSLTTEDIRLDKVGFRASTPDKLPMIGPLSTEAFSKTHYQHALKGAAFSKLSPLQVKPGEWVLTGMGSRGIPFSSLSAEILASLMTGMPLPIETDLFHHLHPVRFTIRSLKKTS